MAKNLYVSHNQWASRPSDEGYFGFTDLLEQLRVERDSSKAYAFAANSLTVAASDEGDLQLLLNGRPAQFTNWSFDQICAMIRQPGYNTQCPSEFLRSLPAPMTASILNTLLPKRFHSNGVKPREETDDFGFASTPVAASESMQVVVQRVKDENEREFVNVRSLHSGSFGLRWVSDIVERVAEFASDGGWMVPPARPRDNRDRIRVATDNDVIPGLDGFALAVKPGDQIAARSLFHSDRNTTITIVNPTRIIDGDHAFMRAAVMDLNDCGYGSNVLYTCLVDSICGNLIFWNVKDLQVVRGYHRAKAIHKWDENAFRQLDAYSEMDAFEEKRIEAARHFELGKDKTEVVDKLYSNKSLFLNKGVIEHAWKIAEQEEEKAKAAPTTAWGVVYGLTRASQQFNGDGRFYNDSRLGTDQAAGKILAWVPESADNVSVNVPAVVTSEKPVRKGKK